MAKTKVFFSFRLRARLLVWKQAGQLSISTEKKRHALRISFPLATATIGDNAAGIAEKLAAEWKTAAALRAAEQEAAAVMQRPSAPNTLSTQTSGVKNTAEGK